MESHKIKMLCDADYCNCSAGRRSREATTIGECEEIYRRANEKGDVGDVPETDGQAI